MEKGRLCIHWCVWWQVGLEAFLHRGSKLRSSGLFGKFFTH